MRDRLVLEASIKQSEPYRKVATPELLRGKKICICCALNEIEDAKRYMKKRFGVSVAHFCIVDWPDLRSRLKERIIWHLRNLGRVKLVPIETLSRRSDLSVVTFGPKERIKGTTLAQHGVRKHYFHTDPGYSPYHRSENFLDTHKANLQLIHDLLDDDESKKTLASIIKHRITGDCGYLRIAPYPQNEHPVVQAKPGDYIIHGGGFDGRCSVKFAYQVGDHGKVFCFEPDKESYEVILKRVQLEGLESIIEAMKMGLWKERARLGFIDEKKGMSIGHRAKFMEEHADVALVDIDSFVEDYQMHRLDLINLDVENGEVPVLEGAQETLKRFRPKLQISIYHGFEDLMKIPMLLDKLGLNYKFFLGHHNTYGTETSLYVIGH